MKLSCAIIDDEPLAVELIESYVKKTPFLDLRCSFYSAASALETLRSEPVDLLFCDIQMPEVNGMELVRMLPDETKVIFTTAFSTYAVEGFRVNAIDYLLKPISYNDFLTAASKALNWFEIRQKGNRFAAQEDSSSGNMITSIYVKTDYKLLRLEFKDILYIEGLKDYVKIHLENQDYPVLSIMSMKALEESLPADSFVRIHRSFIVHLSKVSSIERGRAIIGHDRIPISDTYRDAFFSCLSKASLISP